MLDGYVICSVPELLPCGVGAAKAIGTAAVIKNRDVLMMRVHIPILPYKAHEDTGGDDTRRRGFFNM